MVDLEAIRALLVRQDAIANRPGATASDERWKILFALVDGVPSLVAEVESLRARLIDVFSVIDRLALGHPDWVEYHALRATQGWDGDADLFHARVVAIQSRLEAADRLQAELDAAEGKRLPAWWSRLGWDYDRDLKDRDDLICVRVSPGRLGRDWAWVGPAALIIPREQPGRTHVRLEAKTILAAIEAADAWLKENPTR